MKKVFPLVLLLCALLVSCVSTSIEQYSTMSMKGKKVYLAIDKQTTSVSTGGIGVPVGGMMLYSASSETLKLGSIKNIQLIKQDLTSKGYLVVNTSEEADIVLVGENSSNEFYSSVTLGFYEKNTGDLLMVCEGVYGLGWSMQDDLNKAFKKALESIPRAK